MTRNPNISLASVTDPIKVALLSDDPLMKAGLSSLLAQVGSITVVDRDAAEVALWDAGVDTEKALARLAEVCSLPMPAVAVGARQAHVSPAPPRPGPRGDGCANRLVAGRQARGNLGGGAWAPWKASGASAEVRSLPMPAVAVVADQAHVAPALAAGARGVVLRDQVGPGIHAALAAVRSGLTVMDAALAESLVPPQQPRLGTPGKGRGELTERERQVVQLLSEGLSNKLIADRLGISDHTAKFHVNGVMMKLGASTRTEAVVEAMRRGLIRL